MQAYGRYIMKTLAIAILAAAACLVMTSNRLVLAQNTNCNGRCETQYGVCHAGAEAVLEDCLDRAVGAHEKAVCAAAFVKLEDACRNTESACLSSCGS
jgi:hypothetical protein